MRHSKKPHALSRLFVSAKCATAIPAGSVLMRDHLIQATLDARNHKLDFVSSCNVAGETIRLDAVLATRDDGRYALDLREARPVRDLDDEGLVLLAMRDLGARVEMVTASDVRREPRMSACREIWDHRGVFVAADDRAIILATLEIEGPMQVRKLEQLAETRGDVTSTVYALACEATLDIDLNGPCLSHAVVRTGRCTVHESPALFARF